MSNKSFSFIIFETMSFNLEKVAFDFQGDILSLDVYNDRLIFLMQLESGHKILKVNLANPEVIEDFPVSYRRYLLFKDVKQHYFDD